jgi:hypothetical protein
VFRPTQANQQVIRTENQFVTYRVNVKDRLVKGTNELVITFPSTFLKVGASSTELNFCEIRLLNSEFGHRERISRRKILNTSVGTGILVVCMSVRPNTSKDSIMVYPGVVLNKCSKLRLGLGFAHASVIHP